MDTEAAQIEHAADAGKKPRLLVWWEPRWSFVPRELRDFQSSLRLRSWLRIVVASGAVVLLIAALANLFLPGLQFNWAGAFLASVAVVGGFLLAFLIMVVTFPPLVFVTGSGFGWWWPALLHHGLVFIPRSQLKRVTLTVGEKGRHSLRIRTTRYCKRIGLARGVSLDRIYGLLGDLLIVRDRRRRRRGRECRKLTRLSAP